MYLKNFGRGTFDSILCIFVYIISPTAVLNTHIQKKNVIVAPMHRLGLLYRVPIHTQASMLFSSFVSYTRLYCSSVLLMQVHPTDKILFSFSIRFSVKWFTHHTKKTIQRIFISCIKIRELLMFTFCTYQTKKTGRSREFFIYQNYIYAKEKLFLVVKISWERNYKWSEKNRKIYVIIIFGCCNKFCGFKTFFHWKKIMNMLLLCWQRKW